MLLLLFSKKYEEEKRENPTKRDFKAEPFIPRKPIPDLGHEKLDGERFYTKEFMQKENIEYREINSIEGNILSKIINLIYQLDYVSIYSAIFNKIDPSPVKSIDFIKSKLNE